MEIEMEGWEIRRRNKRELFIDQKPERLTSPDIVPNFLLKTPNIIIKVNSLANYSNKYPYAV